LNEKQIEVIYNNNNNNHADDQHLLLFVDFEFFQYFHVDNKHLNENWQWKTWIWNLIICAIDLFGKMWRKIIENEFSTLFLFIVLYLNWTCWQRKFEKIIVNLRFVFDNCQFCLLKFVFVKFLMFNFYFCFFSF
jgi:hypothetical protein